MTDYKVHLNIKQGNKCQSNYLARSYQGDTGVTGEAMADRLLQIGKIRNNLKKVNTKNSIHQRRDSYGGF